MSKLTVLCLTYNHEKYIKQALDGFVMQKTNFSFEVIIGDDCSTDNTVNIIKEYANKYPDIIKPILREKNIGVVANGFDIFGRAKSEYVAICEGDDYWTDENKLQKQVDFMDANPDFSVCFHPVRAFFEEGFRPDCIFPSALNPDEHFVLSFEELLTQNYIQTNSVVYRWMFNDKEKFGDIFPVDIMPGDWFLHLLHAQRGKICFMGGTMASYRRHSGGIWWVDPTNDESLHLKHGIKELKFFIALEKTFPENQAVRGHMHTVIFARDLFNLYLKNQKFKEMETIMKLCPDLLNADLILSNP